MPKPHRTVRFLLPLLVLLSGSLWADEEYRVYTEHPRLFLRPQRLRLLQRERQRQSMRWNNFEQLAAGKAEFPEPGLALSLYAAVTKDPAAGKRAVDWALGPGADLRQLAFVFDWCQSWMTEAQSTALAAKIDQALTKSRNPRDRILGAIAIAEQNMNRTEAVLRETIEGWRKDFPAQLATAKDPEPGPELMALLELLHAVRDNLTIDLRDAAGAYFKSLAAFEVTANYPAPFPGVENEYRIPMYLTSGDPDLRRAALARAAGLATVAFDTNEQENQFLQGWLIQDRFILKSTLGAPYEFLWANPYQPGLSYAHLPLVFYEPETSVLFLRSDWEENATWFGLYHGQPQVFRDGKITVLQPKGNTSAKAIQIGEASVLGWRDNLRFEAIPGEMFVLFCKPRTKYDVEVDDEEMTEYDSDASGILRLHFAEGRTPGVRIRETPLER